MDRKLLCNVNFDMPIDDFILQLEKIKQKYSDQYDNLYVKMDFVIDSDICRVYGKLREEKEKITNE